MEDITHDILSCAFEVHAQLGPGLLESTYEACLVHELLLNGFTVERQKVLPVVYKGVYIETGYRLDLLVNDSVIIEIKSVEALLPIHQAQLITYLKLCGLNTGLLINFNEVSLKNGIKRVYHKY